MKLSDSVPRQGVLCGEGFARQESSSLIGSCIQDTGTLSGSLGQLGQLQEESRSLVLCLPLLGLVVENRLDISALLVSDRGVITWSLCLLPLDCLLSGSHWGVALWLDAGLGKGHS